MVGSPGDAPKVFENAPMDLEGLARLVVSFADKVDVEWRVYAMADVLEEAACFMELDLVIPSCIAWDLLVKQSGCTDEDQCDLLSVRDNAEAREEFMRVQSILSSFENLFGKPTSNDGGSDSDGLHVDHDEIDEEPGYCGPWEEMSRPYYGR